MIGLPPTAGFFSKWYLITGAIEAQAWWFIGALVLSSLLNAVYFFRIIEQSYLRTSDKTPSPDVAAASRQELPIPMLTPILILATGVLLLGLLNYTVVAHVIQYALPQQVL